MRPPKPTASTSQPATLVFTLGRLRLYFGGLLLLQISLFALAVPFALQGSVDYRTFYTAGLMTRSGTGKNLYVYAAEATAQQAAVSPSENALPFMSPAYTALLFVPLSWIHYKPSFFVFFAGNLALVVLALSLLRTYLQPLCDLWRPLPSLLFLTFLPIGVCLIQGQVAIVLLLAACSSFLLLDRGRPFFAGLVLSIALLKFQIVLPAVLLFILWRRLRFVSGFAVGACALALLSVAISGAPAQAQYLHGLFVTSSSASATANQVRYGIYPGRMPNIFGLAHTILPNTHVAFIATMVASASIFLWAAFQRASLPLAIGIGVVVSYHLYLHDLSVLLLPIALFLSEKARSTAASRSVDQNLPPGWRDRTALSATICLLLAPLERLLIAADLIYLVAIPTMLLVMCLGSVGQAPREMGQVAAETTS